MTRLLIVDQDRPDPHAMMAALAHQPDIELVGLVNSVDAALAQLAKCDTIMVSATLPEDGALELVKAVMNLDPWVRVLVTNLAEAQETSVPTYIEAGAAGWVL
jgi:DNA-binding NarL/FixJ family response regulator